VNGRPKRAHEDCGDEIAGYGGRGFTLNKRISIGVIKAPPPAPVNPTRNPTTALPSTMYGSIFTKALQRFFSGRKV
jgi:hypothetical protein